MKKLPIVQRAVSHIQNWSPSIISSVALYFGSTSLSIITVLVLPSIEKFSKHSRIGGLVSVLISALALGLIVRFVERVLLKIWASPVLGSWIYESSSGNWGLASIHFVGNLLKYKVDLFPDAKSVHAALNNEDGFGEKVFASVDSISVEYDHGKLSLIYVITQTDSSIYAPREGILKLIPLSGGSAMKGFWKSDYSNPDTKDGASPRSGILNLVRVEQFVKRGNIPLLKKNNADETSK